MPDPLLGHCPWRVTVGASKQRQDRREARAAGQQQAAETQSKAAAFDQANQGCLLGRGYTITP